MVSAIAPRLVRDRRIRLNVAALQLVVAGGRVRRLHLQACVWVQRVYVEERVAVQGISSDVAAALQFPREPGGQGPIKIIPASRADHLPYGGAKDNRCQGQQAG